MAKPLLGLTGPSSFTTECISTIEEFFGADMVMLYHNNVESLSGWVERCDGIILGGGNDIHPAVYGEGVRNGCNLSKFDLHRDRRELQIIREALALGKPMLGICRGHQMLGICHGMPILADISNSSICHAPARSGVSLAEYEPAHAIVVTEESRDAFVRDFGMERQEEMSWLLGGKKDRLRLWVNSFHHQAIMHDKDKPPPNVTVYGTSYVGLTKEIKYIVELMSGTNWVACQWHPEVDWRTNSLSQMVLRKFQSMLKAA